jgi:signal transduction histidine kinase
MRLTTAIRVSHRVGRRSVRQLVEQRRNPDMLPPPVRQKNVLLAVDNARLQAELHGSTSELKASRNRVALAADQVRAGIERDLHDGAQQRLVALRIKLNLLQELAADDPQSVARGLAIAGEEIDAALEEIRNLARGIYPTDLRDRGLSDALASVARVLPCDVTLPRARCPRFSPEVESAVYFCCLEALQNVAKHCRAGAGVEVRLRNEGDGSLRFEVADDGQGFDPARALDAHGLNGMRDRIAEIGGELTICSSPQAGTTVTGHVPSEALPEVGLSNRTPNVIQFPRSAR